MFLSSKEQNFSQGLLSKNNKALSERELVKRSNFLSTSGFGPRRDRRERERALVSTKCNKHSLSVLTPLVNSPVF